MILLAGAGGVQAVFLGLVEIIRGMVEHVDLLEPFHRTRSQVARHDGAYGEALDGWERLAIQFVGQERLRSQCFGKRHRTAEERVVLLLDVVVADELHEFCFVLVNAHFGQHVGQTHARPHAVRDGISHPGGFPRNVFDLDKFIAPVARALERDGHAVGREVTFRQLFQAQLQRRGDEPLHAQAVIGGIQFGNVAVAADVNRSKGVMNSPRARKGGGAPLSGSFS